MINLLTFAVNFSQFALKISAIENNKVCLIQKTYIKNFDFN